MVNFMMQMYSQDPVTQEVKMQSWENYAEDEVEVEEKPALLYTYIYPRGKNLPVAPS